MAISTARAYRQPLLDPGDALFRRCLSVAATAGGVFLLAVLITPVRKHVIERVEQLPPRFARLVLEKPKPVGEMPQIPQSPLAQLHKPSGGGGGGGGGEGAAAPRVIRPEIAEVAPPVAPANPGPPSGSSGQAGRAPAPAVARSAAGPTASALSRTAARPPVSPG